MVVCCVFTRASAMQRSGKSCTLSVIFLLTAMSFTRGGNVLVLPGEYSHWHNMRNILEELLNRNHSVTLLVNSASPTVNFTAQERFQFLVFDVPLEAREVHSLSEQMLNIWMQHPTPNRVIVGLQIIDLMGKINVMQRTMCGSMLRNDALVARLRDLKFDVLFYDPMFICSDLLAEILELPLVLTLRLSLGFSMEKMCGQMPTPPSYVPVPPTVMTDHMSFMERVKNIIMYVVYSFAFRMASMSLDHFYSEVLGKVLASGKGFSSHEHR